MKQTNAANRSHVKKSPKIFFWRYYLYLLLLAVIIAIVVSIAHSAAG